MRIRNKLLIAISVPAGLLVLQVALVNFFVRELQEAVTFISLTQDTIEEVFSADDRVTELRDEVKRLPSSFVTDRATGDEGLQGFNAVFADLSRHVNFILASEPARTSVIDSVDSVGAAFETVKSDLENTNFELDRAVDMNTLLERAVVLDASLVALSAAFANLARDLRIELQIAVDREREIHNRPVIAGLAIGGLSLLMLLGFTWLVVDRQFVSRLTGLSRSMQSIAAGDLETKLEKPKGRDEVDEMVRTVETFRVTTKERDRLLEERAKTAERLEAEVAERTAELETANNFKSRFLATASHDLRQPLQALNLFVGQLHETSESEERQRLENRISDVAANMNELFDALLDMSKLEAGILEPEYSAFPISDLFDRLTATFSYTAQRRGISFRVVASDVWVRSDAILLERILLNLLSNAIAATETGGVLVGCRSRGPNIRIDVIDTGPGIPEAQAADLFKEYVQLDPDRKRGSNSLGLGLSIVDGLAKLLGHEITLASEPEHGSRFSITLARAERHQTPENQGHAFDPIAGARILVVDDDALVRESLDGLLTSWGCIAMSSADKSEATAHSRTRTPDLIVADYRLSRRETGLDVVAEVSQLAGRPIPALIMTAETAPERLKDAKKSGYPMLHKPVTPMSLRALATRLLSRN